MSAAPESPTLQAYRAAVKRGADLLPAADAPSPPTVDEFFAGVRAFMSTRFEAAEAFDIDVNNEAFVERFVRDVLASSKEPVEQLTLPDGRPNREGER